MIRMLAAIVGLGALCSLASWSRNGIYEDGMRTGRADARMEFALCNQALINASEATAAAERESQRQLIEAAVLAQQFADEAKGAEESLAVCRAHDQSSVYRSNPTSALSSPVSIARARDSPYPAQ